jgi:hypothetical protein
MLGAGGLLELAPPESTVFVICFIYPETPTGPTKDLVSVTSVNLADCKDSFFL